MAVRSVKELMVYKRVYALSMDIFRLTKTFPPEERFALTSQIRRSSRSVCLNLRECWAKRRYEAHFIAKLTDCDGEINETDTALGYAAHCGYLSQDEHARLTQECTEIGAMLGAMIKNPTPFLTR